MNDLRELELMSEIASLKDKCNTYANKLINLAVENKRLTEFATKYGEKKMELLMENEAFKERIKELEEEINYLKTEKEYYVELATYCDKRCEAAVDKTKKLEERNRILEQKYCDATREADKLRYQNWALNRTYEIKEDIEIYIKEMESV